MAAELTDIKMAQLEELKTMYGKGEMNRGEVSDILEQFILIEISKSEDEIDNAWIDACVDLMQEVDKEGYEQTPDQAERTWNAIQEEIHSQKQPKLNWAMMAIRIAACLALVFGLGTVGHFAWIKEIQTQDDQVYRLEGHDVVLGKDANADKAETSYGLIQTEDFAEICTFLGYTPAVPQWLPENWSVSRYLASKDESQDIFRVTYMRTNEDFVLSYNQTVISDVNTLAADIQQDAAGKYVDLENGLTIYLTTNADRYIAVWTTNDTYTYITGPVSSEELIKIIFSIK